MSLSGRQSDAEAAGGPLALRDMRASYFAEAALCGTFVTLICLVPALMEPGFYFKDDNQVYFQPHFAEIGRLISSGDLPWSTFRSWHGGGITGEYQLAVFHPFSMLLYLIIYPIDSLTAAAAVFSLAHIFVLASGTYVTARLIRATPAAAVIAAFIACSGTWTLYWGATTFVPALVSLSWFAWALAGLILTFKDRRWLAFGAAGCALTFLSGWPLTNLVLCITAGISLLLLWRSGHGREPCIRTALALALGMGLAMPAVLTLAGFLSESARSFHDGGQWQMQLDSLLMVGVPSSFSIWQHFDGTYQRIGLPLTFASWLIPMSLVLLDWKGTRDFNRSILKLLGVLIIMAGLLAMLPALLYFRWSFKALAFLHLFAGLFVAAVISSLPDRMNRPRSAYVMPALLLLGLPYLYTLFQTPSLWSVHIVFTVLIALSVQLTFLAWERNAVARDGVLIGSHVLMLLTAVALLPDNGGDWPLPAAKSEYLNAGPDHPERRLYLYGDEGGTAADTTLYKEIPQANTTFYYGGETINGYSPLEPAGLRKAFCIEVHGEHCGADKVPDLVAPIGDLGLNALDIAAVDAVVAAKGAFADAFAGAMGPDWRIRNEGALSVTFERVHPFAEPLSPVSYTPAGLEVNAVRRTAHGMVLDLAAKPGFEGGDLLLAMPWRPSFHATLGGRTLPVESYHGLVPHIGLPPGAIGELTVSYWPRGLTKGLILAALSLLALLILTFYPSFLSTIETRTNILMTRAAAYLSQRFFDGTRNPR